MIKIDLVLNCIKTQIPDLFRHASSVYCDESISLNMTSLFLNCKLLNNVDSQQADILITSNKSLINRASLLCVFAEPLILSESRIANLFHTETFQTWQYFMHDQVFYAIGHNSSLFVLPSMIQSIQQSSLVLKVNHEGGFFSCCTVRLQEVCKFVNKYHVFPDIIDSSNQFGYYKHMHGDLTHLLFDQKTHTLSTNNLLSIVHADSEDQFTSYKLLNFDEILPIVHAFFTPSSHVLSHEQAILSKYRLDLDQTCAVMYRGMDKCKETNQPSYEEMVCMAQQVKKDNPSVVFLVQTDEKEFIDYFFKHFPDAVEIEENPKINKCVTSIQYHVKPERRLSMLFLYFATMLILSKCKHIITTSGNGEMWMVLYRGNTTNVHQYLRPKEVIYGVLNKSFNPNQTEFWLNH